MKRCPFCGEKILGDATECKHCGKSLSKEAHDKPGKSSVDLESWEGKTIPAWLMYLLVALALLSVWVVMAKGCRDAQEKSESDRETAINLAVFPTSSSNQE